MLMNRTRGVVQFGRCEVPAVGKSVGEKALDFGWRAKSSTVPDCVGFFASSRLRVSVFA
jgi:hypothetical protein